MARKLVGRPTIAAVEQLVRRVLDDPQAKLLFWLPRSEQFVDRHGMAVRSRPDVRGDHLARVRARRRQGSGDRPRRRAERGSRAPRGRRRRLAPDARESPAGTRSARLGGRAARIAAAARGSRVGGTAQDRAGSPRRRAAEARRAADRARARPRPRRRRRARTAGSPSSRRTSTRRSTTSARPRTASTRRSSPTTASSAALREVARRSAVPLTVDLEDVGRLSEDRETAIYYCCLEALQNVAKHAGDDAAALLRLWRDRNSVRFSVTDDGVGFVTRGPAARRSRADEHDRPDRGGRRDARRAVAPGDGTTVLGTVTVEAGDRIGDAAHV